MAGVPDDGVGWALEDSMDGERQLDHPEIGGKVTARTGDLLDQECSDLPSQLLELGLAEPAKVRGGMD